MPSAYGSSGKDSASFRKEWDQEEYTRIAREKDRERQEHAAEAEEYVKQGKLPPKRKRTEGPKPTEFMKAREGPLELDRNINKTLIVNDIRKPGFYCDVCERTLKDSSAYLDHINGRTHLRNLGQTTKLVRSTLDDVRQKIAELREQTQAASQAKKYDFEERLKQIKAEESKSIEEKKQLRKEKKKKKKETVVASTSTPDDAELMASLGFQSFGSSKVK